MKIKNISKGNFNLKSGLLKPGAEGEATFEECKLLLGSSKAEQVIAKPAIKPLTKNKAVSNG